MWNTEEEFSDNNFESDLVHWVSSNWLDLQKNQKTYLDSLNDVTTPPPPIPTPVVLEQVDSGVQRSLQ